MKYNLTVAGQKARNNQTGNPAIRGLESKTKQKTVLVSSVHMSLTPQRPQLAPVYVS